MSEKALVNKTVNIGFSEPWDLSEKLEKDNSIGIITDAGTSINKYYGNKEECVIISLKKSFQFDGLECKYFVASPRHEGITFKNLLNGDGINCSFVRVTKEQAESDNPFDTSWWRGSGGFIATIKLS